MEAVTYDSDDGLTRSPPLRPVFPRLEPLDWPFPSLSSRSPSPWEMRPQRKRHFADFKSRTPSPDQHLNSRSRKRNRKPRGRHAEAILVDLMGDSAHPDLAARAGEETLPQSDDSDLEDITRFRSIRRVVDLPMIIHGSTIIARPDSGSEENIIAADVLSTLDLKMDTAPEHRKEFRVANGKSVWALGRIMVKCSFAKDRTLEFHCAFYVFKTLTSALIMGMAFLDETQTLAKYQYRLQPRTIRLLGPVRLDSLNNPRKRLYCLVNSQPRFANADTGSETDLMSLEYVLKRDFPMTAVGPHDSTVQFADGSTSKLVGKVSVLIVLGTPEGPRLVTIFYVLDGLTCDILFGEDFLDKTGAFKTYRDAFSFIECDDGTTEVNGIFWLNETESRLARVKDDLALRFRSEQSEDRVIHGIKNRIDHLFRRKIEPNHSELVDTVSKSSADLNDLDARELHRREVAQRYISDLPVEERESEIANEDERIHTYEQSRTDSMARLPLPSIQPEPDLSRLPSLRALILEPLREDLSPNENTRHDMNRASFPLSNVTTNTPSTNSIASRPTQHPNSQTQMNDNLHQHYPHDQPSPAYSTETSPQSHHLDIDQIQPVLPPLSGMAGGSLMVGAFKCEYTGCTAPAFQTQYLLTSHMNVHQNIRPHYCPVLGCPRGEGGKGFKRKNEMIRHGLVHGSPGYICPFCLEREHKYPRPENLQRHVRVHHQDKDTNDPQLREVLAQRIEEGSRGIRRRLES